MIDIANFEKISLQDYPGKVSAICFLKGCQLRCPYCHNPDLVLPEIYKDMDNKTEEFIEYITKRNNLIEGVVISGGEPLIEEDLIDLIHKIKSLGLEVKLDTNGMLPERLKFLIDKELLDYIALDYKGSRDSLNRGVGLSKATKNESLYKNWTRTLEMVQDSNIEYELRTTVVRELHSQDELLSMARELKDLIGINNPKWFLQGFEEKFDVLNSFTKEELSLSAYSAEEMSSIEEIIKEIVPYVSLR